ncbi:hypothetical protein [Treponema bryantii]|uniref:hypothetical protein n=1 Tax=Treponema bryantii TaxID=163 RepID=UPI0003B2EAB6|nr:hypothetical protein [Treponema bryantii]
MIDKKVAICLLARDCEQELKRNISKIEELRNIFTSSYVVIIENDSKDNTKKILKDWQQTSNNIILISEDNVIVTNDVNYDSKFFKGMSACRIQKMISCRNKYLEYVNSHNTNLDYVIVFDSDINGVAVNRIEGVIKEAPSDWSAIFANGRFYWKPKFLGITGNYYDAYAYLPFKSQNVDLTYKEIYIENEKLSRLLKNSAYIPCNSAFGGLGIYKYDAIKDKYYHLMQNNRSSVIEVLCEHISINIEAGKKGTLYISKKLKIYYEPIKGFGEIVKNIIGNSSFIKLWEKKNHTKFCE